MPELNFDQKVFALLQNSEQGTVVADTRFEYRQEGNLVTADYHGGTIRYGKIIAELRDMQLHMLYQCMTQAGELKAGKAVADISFNESGKIMLTLQWAWLTEPIANGTSIYVEV